MIFRFVTVTLPTKEIVNFLISIVKTYSLNKLNKSSKAAFNYWFSFFSVRLFFPQIKINLVSASTPKHRNSYCLFAQTSKNPLKIFSFINETVQKEIQRERERLAPTGANRKVFRVISLDTHATVSVNKFSLFGVSNFLFLRERDTRHFSSSARFALNLVDWNFFYFFQLHLKRSFSSSPWRADPSSEIMCGINFSILFFNLR